MSEEARSSEATVDDVNGWRELITAEGKMPEWRRPKAVQVLDEALAPEPGEGLCLIKGRFCWIPGTVLAAQQRRFLKAVPREIEGGLRRVWSQHCSPRSPRFLGHLARHPRSVRSVPDPPLLAPSIERCTLIGDFPAKF